MILIVGLGNPGKKYENTRHNVGFMVLDAYAKQKDLKFSKKFNGLYTEFIYKNDKVILLKPQSYMNASGKVVSEYVNYFKIDNDNIFVIYDDTSFNTGNFKLKKSGSSGGHNGIQDIINSLSTENIKRLKIGISRKNIDLKNYVLGKFGITDKREIKKVIDNSIKVIDDYLEYDFEKLMAKYNGKQDEK